MAASTRWRNLGIAAGAVTAVLFAGFDVYQWAAAYAADHFHNDFTFYLVGARIGLAHGWGRIYDLGLQQAELKRLGSGITVAQLARFISPPPVAWAAVPLTGLPYPVAYLAWSILLVAALALAWWLAAPEAGRARVFFLAAALGWLPVIYGLQLGQPGLLVAAGVALCYALLRRGSDGWAGAALVLLILKPQLAFLVPLALLAAGRWRAFAGSAIALGLIGGLSVIALGWDGVAAYQARLSFAAGVAVNRDLTLAPLLGSVAAARVAQVVVAAWALFIVYRMRHRGPEWIFVPALAGGLLASPYLHLDDYAMLGLAGWLAIRARPARLTWLAVLAAVLVVEGEPFWGPAPLVAAELVAMCLLTVHALRAGPEPHPDGIRDATLPATAEGAR